MIDGYVKNEAHLPDSNQQSNTSSTRRRTPFPVLDGIVISSMLSRWRSLIPVRPESDSNSAIDPMHTICRGKEGQYLVLSFETQYNHLFEILADPQRKRCSPVSISGNVPVNCTLKPISESIVTNGLRDPDDTS